MVSDILIPTLLFWENGNTFYGSKGQARFFIRPVTHEASSDQPDVPQTDVLEVELWKGPMQKQLSQILATATFPLSDLGLEQTVHWLEEQAHVLNASEPSNT